VLATFSPTLSTLSVETVETVETEETEEKEGTVEANEEVAVVAVVKELWNVADPCLIHSGITAVGLGIKASVWVPVLVLKVP